MTRRSPFQAAPSEKACKECGETKPISEFYVAGRKTPWRHTALCKLCWNVRLLQRRSTADGRAAIRTIQERFRRTPKALAIYKRANAQRLAKHPQKARANQLLNNAVKAGRIIRPANCSTCGIIPEPLHGGFSGIQGHHADYSKPYDVMWLCIACHHAEHSAARIASGAYRKPAQGDAG